MRSRNKQITLDVLTGMTATAVARKYSLSRRRIGQVVDRVVFEAKFKSIHAVPDHADTITGYKSIGSRLIPIVNNNYPVK